MIFCRSILFSAYAQRWLPVGLIVIFLSGCLSPSSQVADADRVAADIIQNKQQQALGHTEPFSITRPEDDLRRRLFLDQLLPQGSPATLGPEALTPPANWPLPDMDQASPTASHDERYPAEGELSLSLIDALQIAARNSRDYQSAKEQVFRTALALDLERDAFRTTFAGLFSTSPSTDLSGPDTVSGVESHGEASLTKTLKSGASVATRIGVDLVKLLTGDRSSSLGLLADATISIPLLRGAGKDIVTEPLQQAERDMVYAIWDFERFKRTFAVNVAGDYLSVLRQLDQVRNAEENYRSLITSGRRARRLADAGRLPEFQVDQARQDELRARDRWIIAEQSYRNLLDRFKLSLGLPPDARLELQRQELTALGERVRNTLETPTPRQDGNNQQPVPADAPVILPSMDQGKRGPFEIPEAEAVKIALDKRLDLRVVEGQIDDAQRQVVVQANGLEADLNLSLTGTAGEGRSLGSADFPDARLRPEKGYYSALLSFSPPWERTAERNALRNSLIDLDLAVRDYQQLEDQVKLAVRSGLRNLQQYRETVKIQALSVKLAKRRVESTDLFLRAGRAEIRDLLDAQEALVSAQNALTAALVSYRVGELELQRDMGTLQVDERGLWQETPMEQEELHD